MMFHILTEHEHTRPHLFVCFEVEYTECFVSDVSNFRMLLYESF